eukprot:gene25542-39673_t
MGLEPGRVALLRASGVDPVEDMPWPILRIVDCGGDRGCS